MDHKEDGIQIFDRLNLIPFIASILKRLSVKVLAPLDDRIFQVEL